MADEAILKATFMCIDLPNANWDGHGQIWLGVQRGKEVVQAMKLPIETANFGLEFRVDLSGERPNFLGPFAHGTPQERFAYVCWGQFHGPAWIGFRRAKIPLSGLTKEQLAKGEIQATISCTDAKGGPVCATLKSDYVQWNAP
jgi:hypothetical protein